MHGTLSPFCVALFTVATYFTVNPIAACSTKYGVSTSVTPIPLKDLPKLEYPASLSSTKAEFIRAQIDTVETVSSTPGGLTYVQNLLTIPHPLTAAGVYTVNYLMDFVKSTTELERELTRITTDQQITKAAIAEFTSDLNAIEKQLIYLRSSSLSKEQKYTHLHIALSDCVKISHKFRNPDHVFSKAPLATLSHLRNFAHIFAHLGYLVVEAEPKEKKNVADELCKLRRTLKNYGNLAWAERADLIRSVTDKSCYYLFYTDDGFKRRPVVQGQGSSRCSLPDETKSQVFPARQLAIAKAVQDRVTDSNLCESFDGCYEDYLKKLKGEHLLLLDAALSSLFVPHVTDVAGQYQPNAPNADEQNGCAVNWVKTPLSFSAREVWDGSLSPLDRVKFDNINVIRMDPARDIFLCRVLKDGNWIPGHSDGIKCWIPYNGQVVEIHQNYRNPEAFRILASIWNRSTDKDVGKIRWSKAPRKNEPVDPNAIRGGHKAVGGSSFTSKAPAILFIGRCNIPGVGYVTGYVQDGVVHVASGDRVHTCQGENAEILSCHVESEVEKC